MHEEILQLGKDYDREEQANDIIESFEKKTEEISEKIQGKDHPKVLILMGVPGSYLVGTESSYIGNLVEIAGGENVIKEEDKEFISSYEADLHKQNPTILL